MKTTARILTTGGAVTVELTFGFACVGAYEATLYDKSDENGNTFQTGASNNKSSTTVRLPDQPAELVKRTLLIDASLVPSSPPDMVSITAQVCQDGKPIPGASLTAKASVDAGQKATPMLFFQFTE